MVFSISRIASDLRASGVVVLEVPPQIVKPSVPPGLDVTVLGGRPKIIDLQNSDLEVEFG